jgi:hypothetical protein
MARFIIVDTMSCKLDYAASLNNIQQQVENAMTQGTATAIPLIGNQVLVVNGRACSSVILYDDQVPAANQTPIPPFGRVTSMVNSGG